MSRFRAIPSAQSLVMRRRRRNSISVPSPTLYNTRPQWLTDAHAELDAAVAAAYGWPADISEEETLGELLKMNLEGGD